MKIAHCSLFDLLKPVASATFDPPRFVNVNTKENAIDYKERVAIAVLEIADDQYTKVIVSRALELLPGEEIDMLTSLLWRRRRNTPARTFSLKHEGIAATGFSLELVMSLENGKLVTEPLAGTRSRIDGDAAKLKQELLSDTKEIVEHVISVKAAVEGLDCGLCLPNSVVLEALMSVRE
jgi:salicylate synthetase